MPGIVVGSCTDEIQFAAGLGFIFGAFTTWLFIAVSNWFINRRRF